MGRERMTVMVTEGITEQGCLLSSILSELLKVGVSVRWYAHFVPYIYIYFYN